MCDLAGAPRLGAQAIPFVSAHWGWGRFFSYGGDQDRHAEQGRLPEQRHACPTWYYVHRWTGLAEVPKKVPKIWDERLYSYWVPGLIELIFPDWFWPWAGGAGKVFRSTSSRNQRPSKSGPVCTRRSPPRVRNRNRSRARRLRPPLPAAASVGLGAL